MSRTVDFYCYQPLAIKDNSWISFLAKFNQISLERSEEKILDSKQWSSVEKHIKDLQLRDTHWLHSYTKETQAKFLDVSVCNLADFQNIFLLNETLSEAQRASDVLKSYRLDQDNCSFKLLLVNRSVFMLVFHLRLQSKGSVSTDPTVLRDIPFVMRSVVENPASGCWAQLAIQTAKTAAVNAVEHVMRNTLVSDDIILKSNTGHVFMSYGETVFEGERDILASIHQAEEINNTIASEIDLVKDHEGSFAHFGWSYSTVYGLPDEKAKMCLPFMLHLQSRWFLNGFFKEYLLDSMIRFSGELTSRALRWQSRQYDKLVMAYEISLIKDSQYKGALKPWQYDAYEWVERYWQLPETNEQLKSSMATNKEFVERKLTYHIQATEQRQSFILFVITLIQMLTIVSFFKDYFDLIERTPQPNQFGFVPSEVYKSFTLNLPVGLLAVNALFLIYIYRQNLGDRVSDYIFSLKRSRLLTSVRKLFK